MTPPPPWHIYRRKTAVICTTCPSFYNSGIKVTEKESERLLTALRTGSPTKTQRSIPGKFCDFSLSYRGGPVSAPMLLPMDSGDRIVSDEATQTLG
jgi:hypothetical protein